MAGDAMAVEVDHNRQAANDANNNNNNNNNSNRTDVATTKGDIGSKGDDKNLLPIVSVNGDRAQIQANTRSRQESCNHSETADSDWHLLEVDDQSSSDELNSSNHRNKMNNATITTATTSDTSNKTYIEIDPLGPRQRLSPTWIYICTALYSLVPLASLLTFMTIISLAFTKLWPITLIYFTYLIWDKDTCNKGGRRLDSVYRSKFWSYLAAYFPIKIRHSTQFKLDPNENYLLNYHPHGISAFGCVTAFATNGLNLNELLPGITSRFMVHETSFLVPIMREVFSSRGDCSISSRSIDYMLSQKWKYGKGGNLLALVAGGLAEADLSNAEVLKTVVASRKGFVKKALIHGSNLIPCIAFGENSVYHKVDLEPSSLMYRLQTRWYNLFKFKHPIYYGKSIFGATWRGVMPYKRPITVVIGDPIVVERVESPSQAQVDALHALYLNQLQALYEANGDLCTKYDKKLEMV